MPFGAGARIDPNKLRQRYGNGLSGSAPVMSADGSTLAFRPVGAGTYQGDAGRSIKQELPLHNSTPQGSLPGGTKVPPHVLARQNYMNQQQAGMGVRPGARPPMNAVEFARSQGRGLGGSFVPPGGGMPRNPNDPRNAALGAYPHAPPQGPPQQAPPQAPPQGPPPMQGPPPAAPQKTYSSIDSLPNTKQYDAQGRPV